LAQQYLDDTKNFDFNVLGSDPKTTEAFINYIDAVYENQHPTPPPHDPEPHQNEQLPTNQQQQPQYESGDRYKGIIPDGQKYLYKEGDVFANGLTLTSLGVRADGSYVGTFSDGSQVENFDRNVDFVPNPPPMFGDSNTHQPPPRRNITENPENPETPAPPPPPPPFDPYTGTGQNAEWDQNGGESFHDFLVRYNTPAGSAPPPPTVDTS
jgi:hypothetical protein